MVDCAHIGLRERLFFLAGMSLYFVLHFFQESAMGPEWMRFYLKDLLFIPILLTAVKVTFLYFNVHFTPRTKEVVVAVIYSLVVFEWMVPKIRGIEFVPDVVDMLAYGLGGLLWFILQTERDAPALESENQLKSGRKK
jgi:hypothetical protein